MTKFPVCFIFADLRSAQNVGSLLRTADALGITTVYTGGYTPYPEVPGDARPPHIRHANTKTIAKTSLGAERTVRVLPYPTVIDALAAARTAGYQLLALEQAPNAVMLPTARLTGPTAIILGNEVTGLSPSVLAAADLTVEIPMLGTKESYGVSVAGAIAAYSLLFESSGSTIPG